MADSGNRRVKPRRMTLLGGRLYDAAGKGWDCLIKDLSRSGVKVRTDARFEVGDIIDIKFNKFEDIRGCEVMWAEDGFLGLRFIGEMNTVPDSMEKLFMLFSGAGTP